jgi:non-ribosomal peptide synthetase component E (peptide arylation enzyme)
MEVRALDEQGGVLPPGEVGELGIRGHQVCAGYFANQEATRAAITRDGWFLSGDLGRVDGDGYVSYVGRRKHVIVRGGYKIYAEELEFLLRQCSGVSDVILVAIPDERLGERTCACLVPAGTAPTLAELCAYLERRGVAKYTWPEYLVALDDLPRNAVGKVDRLAVRGLALRAWEAEQVRRATTARAMSGG